jgi:hypothetical protein
MHLIRAIIFTKVTGDITPSIKVQSPDGREGEVPVEGLVVEVK